MFATIWCNSSNIVLSFAPFKNEVIVVLHDISHHLEMPANIISHSSSAQDFNWESAKFVSKSSHKHSVLTTLNDLFNATEFGDEVPVQKELKIKLDKHISEYVYIFKNNFDLLRDTTCPTINSNELIGHPNEINPPPDLSFHFV